MKLGSLVYLNLSGNPACEFTNFRELMIQSLPNLLCLNDYIVSDPERFHLR